MGNANSGELRRNNADVMANLMRQWNADIADDKSRKSESLYKKQWNTLTRNELHKKSGSFNGKSGWKSRKLRSGTQSVKSYQSYTRQKKQFSEGIEFLSENPLYEWKTRSMEELTVMKEDMQRKEIRALDTFRLSGRSKAKRHFRKRRRQKMEKEIESGMWTLSEKPPPPYDQISLKSTKSEESEKIFWKTSKLSLTELQDVERVGSQNMLWRSSKHIQTFCGENVIDVQEVSTVFEEDRTQKIICEADSNVVVTSTLKTAGRKRRFSRWTFLRHDNGPAPPMDAKKQPKSKRNASFRVPQKMYSKYNQSEKCSRDGRVNGKKRWKIFKETQGNKMLEKEEEDEEESCDCSCCSCNGCQSRETKEKLQEDSSSLVLSLTQALHSVTGITHFESRFESEE
ncbi:UNVERIFIED_CONTAM: hypothetical protein PYX00_000161 [Menopon gallinae]|uniref:Uncharacterized protein n=1 Tax=Menopon gallinae TaxID=328185 RepID=A0AAW2I937_9NEOP